jgi:NAD(P)H-dependent flavin oxidoreductase YrpB (nitropropane dioxygenase family)
MQTRLIATACAALITAGSAFAQTQETGATNREANLLAQNNPAATSLAALPKGTVVRVLERAGGGWMRVDAQGKVGWIRTLQYSPPTAVASGSGPGLLGVLSGSQAAKGPSNSAIGTRGLTEEDMKNATPNEAELKKLNAYAQSASQGDQMARSNRLQAASIAFVDDRGRPIAKGSK